jgi:hypothetical protein
MTIEDLKKLHADLYGLTQFIGPILPESIDGSELDNITGTQELIEKIIEYEKNRRKLITG